MWAVPVTISSHESLLGLCGLVISLCSIVVPLRFFARRRQKASIGTDDWLIVPAYLTLLVLTASVIAGTHRYALGYPTKVAMEEGPSPKATVELKLVINVSSTLCFGFTRLSALFFFQRIFCVSHRSWSFRDLIYTMIVLVTLWIIAYVSLVFAVCGNHLAGLWIPTEGQQYCKADLPYLLSASITDAVFELLILCLPIPRVWALQASIRKRVAISLVFLTASLSLVASVARLAIVIRLYQSPLTDASLANSATYFMWVLEAGFALLAVNLPTLYYLRKAIPPERVLRSMRSALSLTSLRSKSSSRESGANDASAKQLQSAKTDGLIEHPQPSHRPIFSHKAPFTQQNASPPHFDERKSESVVQTQ